MSTATPRKRKARGRLSDQQQELAVRYLPLARKLARPLKRSYPQDWEEFESAACLALVEAAEAFEPDRHVKFATFARTRIWGALQDVRRRRHSHGRAGMTTVSLSDLPQDAEARGRVLGTQPQGEVGAELDDLESIEGWLRKLPRGHAAACRQIYLHGKTHAQAARALGLSASRITYIHLEAIAMLNGTWEGHRPRASSARRLDN